MGTTPIAAGKSSFDLIDLEAFLSALRLEPDQTLLDAACGAGNYTMALAGHVREIYAVDLWEDGIAELRKKVAGAGIENIHPAVGDLGVRIPVDDARIDICLMATVLHDLVAVDAARPALDEVKRVLKDPATLAVVEFKKVDGPPGPPKEIRLAPHELERLVRPHGYSSKETVEIGPYHYLTLFRTDAGS
jgi:ubiquinone/menaquinone biosynthesis C-methylase UbiE